MPLLDSFVIWNNKGGVGKTTLTFHMATQYAKRHPDRNVLVIDLCPQANVSMALLGTEQKLPSLFSNGKTISSYLREATSFPTPFSSANPLNSQPFLTQVSVFNPQIPRNVKLLCGDMYLELVSRSLEHKRQADPNSWISITSCFRYFIEGCPPDRAGVATASPFARDWVVFIDTNPSFAAYTEMALVAAQKLIIPISADDFSREAFKAILDMVYGIAEVPDAWQVYRGSMFSWKAQQLKVRIPLIHLMINNRTTSYNLRAALAFREMGQQCIKALYDAYLKNPNIFVPKPFLFSPTPISFNSFVPQYFDVLQDFHTAGILPLHHGCLLEDLKPKVPLFSTQAPVNQHKLKSCQDNLKRLVERL